MNQHPGAGGRPPSYTNNYAPAPAGRTASPMASGTPRTPPSQMMGGPPPINTAASGYPPGHPAAGGMGAPPPAGGPPQYGGGPPQYGAPGGAVGGQSIAAAQYANRNNAVEVEGAGRSKAQLIVGIDFVSYHSSASWTLSNIAQGTTFSGVAFAFATNTEAKEDIITEWPGAGSYTKQKVRVETPTQ